MKFSSKYDASKIPVTGIGLISGTALGIVASILFSVSILFAGIGTCIGVIIGAVIDGYVVKK